MVSPTSPTGRRQCVADAGASDTQGRAVRWLAAVQRAARIERLLYSSIWRAIRKRPAVAFGAKGFGFHKPVLTILFVLIALNALELFILDLVLQRWLPVRIIVDVLDAWGMVWMIGLLCAFLVRPHTVGDDGIHIRNGLDLDIHLDWENVRAVTRSTSRVGTKTPRVAEVDGIRELALRSQGETNLMIDLAAPETITLPSFAPEPDSERIERIRFWADDPKAFVKATREHR